MKEERIYSFLGSLFCFLGLTMRPGNYMCERANLVAINGVILSSSQSTNTSNVYTLRCFRNL